MNLPLYSPTAPGAVSKPGYGEYELAVHCHEAAAVVEGAPGFVSHEVAVHVHRVQSSAGFAHEALQMAGEVVHDQFSHLS